MIFWFSESPGNVSILSGVVKTRELSETNSEAKGPPKANNVSKMCTDRCASFHNGFARPALEPQIVIIESYLKFYFYELHLSTFFIYERTTISKRY